MASKATESDFCHGLLGRFLTVPLCLKLPATGGV